MSLSLLFLFCDAIYKGFLDIELGVINIRKIRNSKTQIDSEGNSQIISNS